MTLPPSGKDFLFAGFWIRAAARLIDLAVLLAAFNLFYLVDRLGARAGLWADGGLFEGLAGGGGLSAEDILRGSFFLLFPVFYYVYLHGAYGQTFGKMALQIRVLREDGSPIGYGKSFLRWLGYFVCDVTLNLGYVWAAFDPRKQGLHDKLCRTIVVKEPSRSGGPPVA